MTLRWLCACAVALAFGCSKAERPVFDKVQLELAGDDDASILGQTDAQVKAQLVTALKAVGFSAAADVKEPKGVWRVEAAVALQEVRAEGDPPARANAVLVLSRRDESGDREVRGRGEAKVKGQSLDERRDASRGAVELALKDAATQAALLLSLLPKNDAELIAIKDGRGRDFALSILAERRNPAALEPLIEKLKSDELDQVRRAIGGLLELRDVRAVPALIEASAAKDDMFQREIVFALGTLGGQEAEAYLQIVADGHDQPLMRASAQQALDELRARADGGLFHQKGAARP